MTLFPSLFTPQQRLRSQFYAKKEGQSQQTHYYPEVCALTREIIIHVKLYKNNRRFFKINLSVNALPFECVLEKKPRPSSYIQVMRSFDVCCRST